MEGNKRAGKSKGPLAPLNLKAKGRGGRRPMWRGWLTGAKQANPQQPSE